MKGHWPFCLILLVSTRLPAFDLVELKDAFRKTATVNADLTQSQTSPGLIKPLLSKIHFRYGGQSIIWTVLEPISYRLILTEGEAKLELPFKDPLMQQMIEENAAASLGFLIKLLRGDLEALEKHFRVELNDNLLTLTPLVQPFPFLSIVIKFDGPKRPLEMILKTKDQTTHLRFDTFVSELRKG